MAVLGSTLLPLGLFPCLVMLFISASSANYSDSCLLFIQIVPTTAPGIKANPDVYERNTIYTISVPVNNNVSSVVLRAVDMNNNSLGVWHSADRDCNSSSLYHMKDSHSTLFRAYWESPHSMNVTAVKIQAFTISFHRMATFSSLTLKKRAMTTTSPFTISTTRPPKTHVLPTTRILNPTSTLTTTSSVASGIFLSPIADALQILLVFLTSKLLF
nr:PREDICTED: placenta-expressed transcript 1 protein [Rhinolophus sinicus]